MAESIAPSLGDSLQLPLLKRSAHIRNPKTQFSLHFLMIFLAAREAALAADLIKIFGVWCLDLSVSAES